MNDQAVAIRAAADEEGDFLLVSMMEDHVAYYENKSGSSNLC